MMDLEKEVPVPMKKCKSTRNSNWTEVEKDIILEQCTQQALIIHGPICASLTTQMKNKVWEEIASKVNSAGGANRTLEQVKNKWKNMRSRSVEKVREYTRESKKTGRCNYVYFTDISWQI